MDKKFEARVKQDYNMGSVQAFSGREFSRAEWRPVPAGFEEEAKNHPLLDVREMKTEFAKAAPAPVKTETAEAMPAPEKIETTFAPNASETPHVPDESVSRRGRKSKEG